MIPVSVILANLGLEFHVVHYIIVLVGGVFSSQSLLLKVLPFHRMMHEVQPLYRMAHYEHHVCKSIHPTTSGVGLWEPFLYAGDQIPFAMAVFSLPYLGFFLTYFG